MAELLFNQREIYICGNQVTGDRMLQSVRMPFFWGQSGRGGNRLEQPKELTAVQSAAFLRDEQEILAVIRTLPQPLAQGFQFIKQWLSAV